MNFLASLLFSASIGSTALAQDEFDLYPVLKAVGQNNLYYSAFGDGYETGVELTLSTFVQEGLATEDLLDVVIPRDDNYAACSFTGFSAVNATSLFAANITVNIATSVEGDSGGCLVFVKTKADNRTIAILDYRYTTDY